jgi:hypothetical protein
MNKTLIIFFLVISCSLSSFSQDMSSKLAKEICECLEKEKVASIEKMNPCFEKALVNNLKEIYKVYKIESIEDLDFEKFGVEIGNKLMTECNYAIENLTPDENKFEKDFVPEKNLDCSSLKIGEFYYLTSNTVTQKSDTTFVTIKNKMYLERMNNGRTYSILDINWIDKCKFELVFKDSNDPLKSVMSEPGEKYNYQMVSSTPSSYILKLFWRKQEYKIEFFKTK